MTGNEEDKLLNPNCVRAGYGYGGPKQIHPARNADSKIIYLIKWVVPDLGSLVTLSKHIKCLGWGEFISKDSF